MSSAAALMTRLSRKALVRAFAISSTLPSPPQVQQAYEYDAASSVWWPWPFAARLPEGHGGDWYRRGRMGVIRNARRQRAGHRSAFGYRRARPPLRHSRGRRFVHGPQGG